jgi:hypothetical protein
MIGALEPPILQESNAGPHVHAALEAGAGDDAVADRGVGVPEEDERILDQNRQADPASLTGVLLVEIATISAGIGRLAALGRRCRDRAEIGVEWQRNVAAEPGRPSCTGEGSAIGSGNSRRSTPKSRRIALLPEPNGVSSIRSIATTSPALAPRTTIGPAIGARGCRSQAGVNGIGTALISSTSSKARRTSTITPRWNRRSSLAACGVLTENREAGVQEMGTVKWYNVTKGAGSWSGTSADRMSSCTLGASTGRHHEVRSGG